MTFRFKQIWFFSIFFYSIQAKIWIDVLRIVHVLEFEHQDPMFGDSLEPVPRSYDKIWAAVEMIIYFVHFETLNIVLFLLQV